MPPLQTNRREPVLLCGSHARSAVPCSSLPFSPYSLLLPPSPFSLPPHRSSRPHPSLLPAPSPLAPPSKHISAPRPLQHPPTIGVRRCGRIPWLRAPLPRLSGGHSHHSRQKGGGGAHRRAARCIPLRVEPQANVCRGEAAAHARRRLWGGQRCEQPPTPPPIPPLALRVE